MKYTIECLKIRYNKIYRCWGTFDCKKPHEAMDAFIQEYLAPIDYCDTKKGGVEGEENKYISCRVGYKNAAHITYLLSCRYKEVKKKYAQIPKNILDKVIKDSSPRVESAQPSTA